VGTPPVPPSPSRFPPPAPPGSGPASPAVVAAALAGLLARHGLTRIYTAACPLFAVISVAGLTIWTNGLVLWWTVRGQPGTWPAADPDGAAAHLAQVAASTHP
jgi:hypothetical protein